MSINQFLDQLGNDNKNEYAEFPNTLSETDKKILISPVSSTKKFKNKLIFLLIALLFNF